MAALKTLTSHLETQFPSLVTDKVTCLLYISDLVALGRDDQEIIIVAEKCHAVLEQQADQLLP